MIRETSVCVGLVLMSCFGSVAASAAHQSPISVAPSIARPDVTREYLGIEGIAAKWASEVTRKHGLKRGQCRIQMPPAPRSVCTFWSDGISVTFWKEGRAPTLNIGAIPIFANEIDLTSAGLTIVGGKWIRVGDLFELQAAGDVHAFDCAAIGEADYVSAQCSWARDWPSISARSSWPQARYRFTGGNPEVELGRAFASGSIRARHNGKPLSLKALAAAAGDFARADFNVIAK
jgi:hypothetical protein